MLRSFNLPSVDRCEPFHGRAAKCLLQQSLGALPPSGRVLTWGGGGLLPGFAFLLLGPEERGVGTTLKLKL